MKRTVVLAYSGGLDTSVCVKWLSDRGWNVIAFMADVGQGGPLAKLSLRAKKAGAIKVVVKDLRREFVNDYVWPSLKANAVYEGEYLLATALSRPLIAKHLVAVAKSAKAQAIAHGCTGKGNDQVRFEVTSRMLDPKLEIVAPVREWEFSSREEQIEYAKQNNIGLDVTPKSPYSIDQNLWGLSIEAGVMEDPWSEPPRDTYRMICPPERATSKVEYVTVDFTKGIPTGINGHKVPALKLIDRLNTIGARHSIGRTDMIESRVIGIKSREVYEAPAGTLLLAAHQDLERMVLDREVLQAARWISTIYARLVYEGLWESPLKNSLDGFVNVNQKKVTGSVKIKLCKGSYQVVGRKSPNSLYAKALATYSGSGTFDERAAEDFIKLWGLPYEGLGQKKS